MNAITFDFWDTIVVDDSDEAKRAAQGLLSKPQARRELFVNEIIAHHPEVGKERAQSAFDHCNERFRHWWKVEHRTPPIGDRLLEGFTYLGLGRTPGFDKMVDAFASMEVDIPPDLAPGIKGCLQALHGRYQLGIISDAIVTPGSGLRTILENYGIKKYFQVFIFSGEAGAAKPDPLVFELACQKFRIKTDQLVHIGDREANDVGGPYAFGAHSVLYTGAVDRGSSGSTQADAVCTHHDALPGIIDSIFR
jgi:FMN phosphatase YigB (HAD superfamily)